MIPRHLPPHPASQRECSPGSAPARSRPDSLQCSASCACPAARETAGQNLQQILGRNSLDWHQEAPSPFRGVRLPSHTQSLPLLEAGVCSRMCPRRLCQATALRNLSPATITHSPCRGQRSLGCSRCWKGRGGRDLHFSGLEVCSPASGHRLSLHGTPSHSATNRAPYPGRKLLSCPPPKSMGCSGVVVPGPCTYSAPIRGP